MRYTKGAIDESELARYNSTLLCGLDNTLPNSYANALIQVIIKTFLITIIQQRLKKMFLSVFQVLYYIPGLQHILLEHLCQREFCLACELSFLFHMLDVGRTQCVNSHPITVQPANFLRAFRTLPEAAAMGLLISDAHPEIERKNALPRLAQVSRNGSFKRQIVLFLFVFLVGALSSSLIDIYILFST